MSTPENVSDGSVPPRLGDYLLGQLIAEDKDAWTYHARQRSVDRGVVLVRQKATECDQPAASFLGDVRARPRLNMRGLGLFLRPERMTENFTGLANCYQGSPLRSSAKAGKCISPWNLPGC